MQERDQDLSDMFSTQTDDSDLSDLFGTEEPEDELGDLFGSESVEVEADPIPVQSSDDLSSLFGDEAVEQPASSAEAATPITFTDVQESDASQTVEETATEEKKESFEVVEEKPTEEPEKPRRRQPPVFGELSRPTRSIDLSVPIEIKGRKKTEEAKEETMETAPAPAAEENKVEKTEQPVSSGWNLPQTSEETPRVDNQPEEGSQSEAAAFVEVTEPAETPEAADEETSSLFEGENLAETPVTVEDSILGEEVPQEANEADDLSSWASESLPVAPVANTEDDELRRNQEAAKAKEEQRIREQQAATRKWLDEKAKLEQEAEYYRRRDELWQVVDRILGFMGTREAAQNIVKDFSLTRDPQANSQQMSVLQNVVRPILSEVGITIDANTLPHVFELLYDEIVGISVLGPLWRDEDITEIMVDAWNKISIERNGALLQTPLRFKSHDHAISVARDLAQKISNRALSNTSPIITAELPRARVQFVLGPSVKSGISITIRKFRPLLEFKSLLGFGTLNEEMAAFLQDCVLGKANVLVSGGTNTGKTTMINLLSGFIPESERVVTIEDSFELELKNEVQVNMQTKEKASADDSVEVVLKDLLRSALRMNPDRIIVGEIREPEGAETMITAANTGHEGTMTTIHANSANSALNQRLSTLIRRSQGVSHEIAREDIITAFQVVIQVTRKRGKRFISEIAVVDPSYINEEGWIRVHHIFKGTMLQNGEIDFIRAGNLEPDTVIYDKLSDAGIDVSKWEK